MLRIGFGFFLFFIRSLDLQCHMPHNCKMADQETSHKWLRSLVEYGPIAIFFIAYYWTDLFFATASLMGAAAFMLSLSYVVEKRVPLMPLITAGVIGIFGGLTIWLQDETFIKMKPTIIQFLFGLVLIVGLMLDRLFLKSLLGVAWNILDEGWRILTLRLSAFFFFSAILNEIVWRTQSTDFWVNFKVFGLMGITLIFFLFQAPLFRRYVIENKDDAKN